MNKAEINKLALRLAKKRVLRILKETEDAGEEIEEFSATFLFECEFTLAKLQLYNRYKIKDNND